MTSGGKIFSYLNHLGEEEMDGIRLFLPFHGGNTGSNPVRDANGDWVVGIVETLRLKTFMLLHEMLRT